MTDNLRVEAHASTIAGWYWCAKRCIDQLNGIRPEIKHPSLIRGTDVHTWLSNRPRTRDLQEVKSRLEEFKVKSTSREGTFFHRPYGILNVYGDIDDFIILETGEVRLIEYKTVSDSSRIAQYWYISPYILQVQIYCWLLAPILQQMKLRLADTHMIQWFDSKTALRASCVTCGRECDWTAVRRNDIRVERELTQIIAAYQDPKNIIYPRLTWKCKTCDSVYSSTCPHGSQTLAAPALGYDD